MNGVFIALKGPKFHEEYLDSINAIDILGGKLSKNIEYDIADQKRVLTIIDKVKRTNDKYPRIYGKIKSKPL